MTLRVSLDDKDTATDGRVLLTGTQALVRPPLTRMRRDRAAGLNTAAFISGCRGSPLGGYDQQLLAARRFLDPWEVTVQPGVNEDLAATAVRGTQQVPLSRQALKDGVLGIWYGKGPGVDRSGDVFRRANAAGASAHGGVFALAVGRPHRPVLVDPAPVGPRRHLGDHAGALPLVGARAPGAGAARHRPVAGLGLLGGVQGHLGDGRDHGRRGPRARGAGRRHPRRRPAVRRPAHPLARPAAGAGREAAGVEGLRRPRRRARQTGG